VPRLGSPRRRAIGEMDLDQMRETHCYHRRRGPSRKHEEFRRLAPEEKVSRR